MTTLNAAAAGGHGRGRRRGGDRRHRVRAARPPAQDARGERASRRGWTRRRARCSPASSTWPQRGVVPGGTEPQPRVRWTPPPTGATLTQPEQLVLADAQTSGGLLIATRHPERAARRARRTRGRPLRDRRGRSRAARAASGRRPARAPGSSPWSGISERLGSICTCNGRAPHALEPHGIRMTELDGVFFKEIVEQGLREFPNECCGLIAANGDGAPGQGLRR